MNAATDIADLPDTFASAALSPGASRAADFYEMTKPRLNFLVLVTTAVGYYMAARSMGDWPRLLHVLLGAALTAGGASVLNQLMERDYDKLMPRTRNRPLPAGRIAPVEALLFGSFLGVVGVLHLFLFVNMLTALLGAITLLSYLFIYTPMKRYTTLNTVIGAVPGAIPPVMGWTAVHGALSPEALSLFCILFLWQMPHFLSIAILYRRDYAAGGFKMLPVVDRDLTITSRQIVLYSLALIPITLMPALIGMAGAVYFTAAMLLGLAFLSFAVSCAATRERVDARKLFFASIIYLPVLLAAMMMNKL